MIGFYNIVKKNVPFSVLLFLFLCFQNQGQAQQFPGVDENIPHLITFGKQGSTSWGDNDFSQTFFLSVPPSQKKPIYVRVFDPDVGGEFDEIKGEFNSYTKFQVYGGKGALPKNTSEDAQIKLNRSGTLLGSKTFGKSDKYDGKWYTFGPFNPSEGEWIPEQGSFIFKVIADGISGDDGNIYKYYLSVSPTQNIEIEGANAFTYEYTFRLPNNRDICHIYPYVDSRTVSVKQLNFDWDGDGAIRIISVARKGENVELSGDDNWGISRHTISDEEKETSLDIQLVKSNNHRNNNVVFRITNQYGEAMPFYSIPIGGKPVYRPKISMEKL